MALTLSKRAKWFAALLVALILLVALTWNWMTFAVALALSESRPSLLTGAEWGRPAPEFQNRFREGTSETELLDWLKVNGFQIDERGGHAARHVRSLPCNESIAVSWRTANRLIRESSAVVSEAGCL